MAEVTDKKPKIRTMEELSEVIRVSRPTLSKYFQDSDSVRPSTKDRIEAALASVDYVPNFFATRMNRQSSRIIGVIVPYLNDLFFTSLIQSVEKMAVDQGYSVMIQSAHGDPALEERAFENLLSMSADGVIVAPIGQESSREGLQRLKDALPVVFVDSRFSGSFEDVDFVGTNNEQSISLMVTYLYRSGEVPVFFGMPRINANSREREKAYINSARNLGFEPEFVETDGDRSVWNFEEFAFDCMNEHFANGRYLDSTILCANDRLAIGVVKAANQHKLLPRSSDSRFRVAGHDDHPLAAYIWPALTTVSRNTAKIGETAVDLVLDQIENGKRREMGLVRTFDAELRLRDSA